MARCVTSTKVVVNGRVISCTGQRRERSTPISLFRHYHSDGLQPNSDGLQPMFLLQFLQFSVERKNKCIIMPRLHFPVPPCSLEQQQTTNKPWKTD